MFGSSPSRRVNIYENLSAVFVQSLLNVVRYLPNMYITVCAKFVTLVTILVFALFDL